jgi:hypothetical protein
MEQVITAGGKFYADETVWANIVFGDYEVLHSSLSMNFCIPHCPRIFVILLHSSLGDAFPPCMRR